MELLSRARGAVGPELWIRSKPDVAMRMANRLGISAILAHPKHFG
jgi:hypothetical protein